VRLSWNEIRARAGRFAGEWAGQGYEKGQTQLFYRDFFEVFGVPVRRVASFEEPVRRLGDRRGYIDLFWKGVLLVEQKSRGRDLKKARAQALDYFPGIRDSELPRYLLLSDFQSFELIDLDTGEEIAFDLASLPEHVEKFGFIIGVEKRTFRDQDPVNIQAAERVGRLHDALANSGYRGYDLERFLVRVVFCLFADDTGIFEPRDIFLDLIEHRTREDGSDVGSTLTQLFQVMDTPESNRQAVLDEDLARFPYVNGRLFSEPLRIPAFDSEMRERLLEACRFDWSNISPAIFGSLFQSVMDQKKRRAIGAHYTTEKNILKVIEPLFMDGLRAEFDRMKALKRGRSQKLHAFLERLADLTFFDPACGCGNFLIIAYRELRQLEMEALRLLYDSGQLDMMAETLSRVNVHQFHGIEIEEFPALIAETALWMMDHLMNNRLSLEFGQVYLRIPLTSSPHIVHGDALEIDWGGMLSPERCDFVFGNPPFVGAKYQSKAQRGQVKEIAEPLGAGGTLDYVAAWFLKAGEYATKAAQAGRRLRIGFVATNSITQGEQVAQLWPVLFDHFKLEIAFAHRTFSWGSEARGAAHVHVVIVGLERAEYAPAKRRLFSYPDLKGDPGETVHPAISAYLFDASQLSNPHVVVKSAPRPVNGMPRVKIGSKPIDGGNYILTEEGYRELCRKSPDEAGWFRPFIGSKEYLNGGGRWIVHPASIPVNELAGLPGIRERMAKVREFREQSKSAPTRAIAATPGEFHVTVIPDKPFLVLPEVSSERREYVPIGWLEPPVIPSNLVRILEGATLAHFALLTSAMHMAWLRHIGGRLKSDYRYSIGLVYNTFPLPPGGIVAAQELSPLAQAVLDARAAHPGATLAQLYDPDLMPSDLRRAHGKLDQAVDHLYHGRAFGSDRERAEFLLGLYEKMVGE